MPGQAKTREQFADFYVAAQFADAGWNVYLPRWDNGFDFMIERTIVNDSDRVTRIRPIQVRGKYPTDEKGETKQYGIRRGRLSRTHPDMVLAMPFFTESDCHPTHVAYLPMTRIKPMWDDVDDGWSFSCLPAGIRSGAVYARQEYQEYFDAAGLAALVG